MRPDVQAGPVHAASRKRRRTGRNHTTSTRKRGSEVERFAGAARQLLRQDGRVPAGPAPVRRIPPEATACPKPPVLQNSAGHRANLQATCTPAVNFRQGSHRDIVRAVPIGLSVNGLDVARQYAPAPGPETDSGLPKTSAAQCRRYLYGTITSTLCTLPSANAGTRLPSIFLPSQRI